MNVRTHDRRNVFNNFAHEGQIFIIRSNLEPIKSGFKEGMNLRRKIVRLDHLYGAVSNGKFITNYDLIVSKLQIVV